MSKTSSREISSQQQSFSEAMQGLHPSLRTMIGLIGSATLAFYIPMTFVTIFGLMVNTLADWKTNAICITVLMFASVIGLSLKRLYPIALVCGICLDLYILSLIFRMATPASLLFWLIQLVIVPLIFLLNAYLLTKFRAVTS